MNIVVIRGNLGADPKTNDKGTVCNFSVATNETVKRGDTYEQETEWHRVVVLGASATAFVSERLRKGMPVTVRGKLRTNVWKDKDGLERQTKEIIADPFGVEFDGASTSVSDNNSPRMKRRMAD